MISKCGIRRSTQCCMASSRARSIWMPLLKISCRSSLCLAMWGGVDRAQDADAFQQHLRDERYVQGNYGNTFGRAFYIRADQLLPVALHPYRLQLACADGQKRD